MKEESDCYVSSTEKPINVVVEIDLHCNIHVVCTF